MLTKYTITIGATEYAVPEECLMNWDEIAFSLSRSSYSGVMRSYSTQFVFVGTIRDRLWEHYLANGFNATASVAVHTITDTHEWEKQFEAPLDFSSIENEQGKLTINAIDNTLAAMLKAKKGQKYEFIVGEMPNEEVSVLRLLISNNARWNFSFPDGTAQSNWVDMLLNNAASAVITNDYVALYDEISVARTDHPENEFFAKVVQRGASLTVTVDCTVLCRLYNDDGTLPADGVINLMRLYESGGENVRENIVKICDNYITSKIVGGRNVVYSTVDDLIRHAGRNPVAGTFGIVGNYRSDQPEYLDDNVIYEYDGRMWEEKGSPRYYRQYREVFKEVTVSWGDLYVGDYLLLAINGTIRLAGGTMYLSWADPVNASINVKGIRPIDLAAKLVKAIYPDAEVTIADDEEELLADTFILPGESIRNLPGAKVYTTFQDFCSWMEAVFGYTYRIVGNVVQFVHRSEVFNDDDVKVIEHVRDVQYTVNDNLLYTEVDAGYGKKEYGEIDGRYEKNFTNYYATGYDVTDRKLSLISKYRADEYGIEFTARKGESVTKDDKADEDVFFCLAPFSGVSYIYEPGNNADFGPAMCVERNAGLIAAMGNGKAVTLTMTSSDGNNELEDITIAAGTALFSAGVLDFTTDDMREPADLNGLVQLDYQGYRYTGFISEMKARYGRENGFEYSLIVKDITTI